MIQSVRCSKCGYSLTVRKTVEHTEAWFKKWHFKICDGKPERIDSNDKREAITDDVLAREYPATQTGDTVIVRPLPSRDIRPGGERPAFVNRPLLMNVKGEV